MNHTEQNKISLRICTTEPEKLKNVGRLSTVTLLHYSAIDAAWSRETMNMTALNLDGSPVVGLHVFVGAHHW